MNRRTVFVIVYAAAVIIVSGPAAGIAGSLWEDTEGGWKTPETTAMPTAPAVQAAEPPTPAAPVKEPTAPEPVYLLEEKVTQTQEMAPDKVKVNITLEKAELNSSYLSFTRPAAGAVISIFCRSGQGRLIEVGNISADEEGSAQAVLDAGFVYSFRYNEGELFSLRTQNDITSLSFVLTGDACVRRDVFEELQRKSAVSDIEKRVSSFRQREEKSAALSEKETCTADVYTSEAVQTEVTETAEEAEYSTEIFSTEIFVNHEESEMNDFSDSNQDILSAAAGILAIFAVFFCVVFAAAVIRN